MWCVADLTEDYIAKMEDVLETYEQPYDPKQLVSAWTKSRSRYARMSVLPLRPMFSAR
jgi:hypothetical protein